MTQEFYFWIYTQKNLKQDLEKLFVHLCSEQHYSQEPKCGSNSSAHQQLKRDTKCGLYLQEHIIQP